MRGIQYNSRLNLTGFKDLRGLALVVLLGMGLSTYAQHISSPGNLVWTSQSKNSSESMPCGGGDIGLNVWVENNMIYAYVSRSGTFDENNTLLKLGRVRLKLSPNPFDGGSFKQELILKDGYVQINGSKGKLSAKVNIWVGIPNYTFEGGNEAPVVHFDVDASQKIDIEASYESWRHQDRITKGKENNQGSYKWAPQGEVKTFADSISFEKNAVSFYHANRAATVFDVSVKQQGLEKFIDSMYNPLKGLAFGGLLQARHMRPAGNYNGIYLNTPFKGWILKTSAPSSSVRINLSLMTRSVEKPEIFKNFLRDDISRIDAAHDQSWAKSKQWWNQFWSRSFVRIASANDKDAIPAQMSRNYELFRYMLGCNAKSDWPTKFNGGLFTYDPVLVDTNYRFSPDFRNWGGGTHTAQNQRLVYWPMLKNGDFDMMHSQFSFYLRILKNAEMRTQNAWQHKGASFTEQLENYGLPNPAEYGWKRPVGFDVGLEYNAWLEYQWDTVLEFCLMALDAERYSNSNESATYMLPLIESCLTFFKEHYMYLAKQRGSKGLDGNGKLILFPGSGAETYKMAYNSTSTIAALQTLLIRLIESPSLTAAQKDRWREMLKMIPPIAFRSFEGHTTIAPAVAWERINNVESPQLYPVFPWGIYGIGKPGLDTAINTYKFDTDVIKFRSHVGWKQDNIFAARLGLTSDAARLTALKLQDSGRRFPAFWGPGFDWTPDHNWGGSGMIGLQEMLMQVDGRKIYLFPAWPKDWNVHFKLHAPYQTTVEAELRDGKVKILNVVPEARRADIVVMNFGVDKLKN